MRKHLTTLLLALSFSAVGAYAQSGVSNIRDTGVPTLSDLTPEAGLINETKIVFTGTATDTIGSTENGGTETISGIDRVEYRIEGSRRWHRATLTARGETTTTFFFSVKVGKGQTKRVYIRARDRKNNESDTVGRWFKHSKTLIRRSSTTTTTTTTGA